MNARVTEFKQHMIEGSLEMEVLVDQLVPIMKNHEEEVINMFNTFSNDEKMDLKDSLEIDEVVERIRIKFDKLRDMMK